MFVQHTNFMIKTEASAMFSIRKGNFKPSLDVKNSFFWSLFTRLQGGTATLFWITQFMSSNLMASDSTCFTSVHVNVNLGSLGSIFICSLNNWSVTNQITSVVTQSEYQLEPNCKFKHRTKYLCLLIDRLEVSPGNFQICKCQEMPVQFLDWSHPPAQLWLRRLAPHINLRMRSLKWQFSCSCPSHQEDPTLQLYLRSIGTTSHDRSTERYSLPELLVSPSPSVSVCGKVKAGMGCSPVGVMPSSIYVCLGRVQSAHQHLESWEEFSLQSKNVLWDP